MLTGSDKIFIGGILLLIFAFLVVDHKSINSNIKAVQCATKAPKEKML